MQARERRVRVDLTRIRHAASTLANRHGLDGLSMHDLARALHIRTPSLYSHVGGLAEVKRLLAQETNWIAALGAAALDHSTSRVASPSSPLERPGVAQLFAKPDPAGPAG